MKNSLLIALLLIMFSTIAAFAENACPPADDKIKLVQTALPDGSDGYEWVYTLSAQVGDKHPLAEKDTLRVTIDTPWHVVFDKLKSTPHRAPDDAKTWVIASTALAAEPHSVNLTIPVNSVEKNVAPGLVKYRILRNFTNSSGKADQCLVESGFVSGPTTAYDPSLFRPIIGTSVSFGRLEGSRDFVVKDG